MSIAGGLLPSESLPTQKRHDNYAPAGEGRFVVLPNGTKMAAFDRVKKLVNFEEK